MKKKIKLTLVAEKIRARSVGNTGFRGEASSGDRARAEGKSMMALGGSELIQEILKMQRQ